MQECLFCRSPGPFSTVEHIIPESLGNDDVLLRGVVCDSCQAYFGKEVERYVLDKSPLAFWRTILAIPTKKGRLPAVDLSQPSRVKGSIPARHPAHDDVAFTAHEDGSVSVEIQDQNSLLAVIEGRKTQFKVVMTPKLLHMLGRFLLKVGIELIATSDLSQAFDARFDEARRFARYGRFRGLWPLFHANTGELGELRKTKLVGPGGEALLEEVMLYAYSLLQCGPFTLLRLQVETDVWLICLDDPFPSPTIRSAFPDIDLKLIWYDMDEIGSASDSPTS